MRDNEVVAIVEAVFKASDALGTSRTTYLRAVVKGAQEELGTKRGQEAAVQLTALRTVHDRYYELVLRIAEEYVPKGTKGRSVELHRRANFARTAVSALRTHVRAGGDLVSLSVDKVTKGMLKSRAGPVRPPSIRRLKAKAEVQSKALVATLIGLADTDKASAVEELQLLLGQITTQLVGLGVIATKDAATALAEHRPLKVGSMLFIPTATQVMRQRINPS